MNPDWLIIALFAGAVISFGIAFILGACWVAGRADEQAERFQLEKNDLERVVRHGDQHPWMDR